MIDKLTLKYATKSKQIILPIEHRNMFLDDVLEKYRKYGWNVVENFVNEQNTEGWCKIEREIKETDSVL